MPNGLLSLAQQSSFLLCGERAFVKANDRTLPGRRFNRQNVKSERDATSAVLANKLTGHSRKVPLLFGGNGILRGAKLVARRGSCFYFHEGEGLAIVSDEINLSFDAAIRE